MLDDIRRALGRAIAHVLEQHLGVTAPAVAIDIPPRRELGDLPWGEALEPRAAPRSCASRRGRSPSRSSPICPPPLANWPSCSSPGRASTGQGS